MFINPNSKKTIKHSQDPSLCTFGGGPDKENESEVDKFEISCISLSRLQSSEEVEPTASIETLNNEEVKRIKTST